MTEKNKKKVKIVVVLPVGPTDSPIDTIESIFFYMKDVHIIVLDDSRNSSTRPMLQNIDERITIFEVKGHGGTTGSLWMNLASTYKYAVVHFDFEILLKIDTDALVIAVGSEDEAIEAFTKDPRLGMLGSCRIDCNGDRLPRLIAANVIWRESGFRGYKTPERHKLLHRWVKLARQNGYRLGEYVQGGADFHSYACIKAMSDGGFLDTKVLADSRIPEDFLFSILTMTCGYRLGDFSTGDFPLGIRWRGLPDSPENLIKRKKKIIHSIRFWKEMNEKTIRDFFAGQRNKERQKIAR